MYPEKNGRQGNCDFDFTSDTNLNGAYHNEERLNQRTISICDSSKDENDCFYRSSDGVYEFRGSTVKLAQTRMYLGHSS